VMGRLNHGPPYMVEPAVRENRSRADK